MPNLKKNLYFAKTNDSTFLEYVPSAQYSSVLLFLFIQWNNWFVLNRSICVFKEIDSPFLFFLFFLISLTVTSESFQRKLCRFIEKQEKRTNVSVHVFNMVKIIVWLTKKVGTFSKLIDYFRHKRAIEWVTEIAYKNLVCVGKSSWGFLIILLQCL